ncbi:uncharacterized protein LOC144884632 [Branchiostoma floridae x Branchiostoma japonicum]
MAEKRKKRANGRKGKWTNEETKLLLSIWGQEETQRKLGQVHKNKDCFEDIAKGMADHGFEKTYEQCRNKMKNLTAQYRKHKDQQRTSGVGRKDMLFFPELDAILADHPSTRPVKVVESMTSSSGDSSSSSSSSESESDDNNEDLAGSVSDASFHVPSPPSVESQDNNTEEDQLPANTSSNSAATSSGSAATSSGSAATSSGSADKAPPSSRKNKKKKEKTRHKKSKTELALENFAKGLPIPSIKDETTMQLKIMAAQHAHEMKMFEKMLAAFSNKSQQEPSPAVSQPQGQGASGGTAPSQGNRSNAWQQQGGWSSPGPNQEHYSGAWGGAGPNQERYSGAWGGAGPNQERYSGAWGGAGPNQEEHYSGAWGGAGPNQERYSGAWGGAGPNQERYSGAWGGAGPNQEEHYSGAWGGAGPNHTQAQQPGCATPPPIMGQRRGSSAGTGTGARATPPSIQAQLHAGVHATSPPTQGGEQELAGSTSSGQLEPYGELLLLK